MGQINTPDPNEYPDYIGNYSLHKCMYSLVENQANRVNSRNLQASNRDTYGESNEKVAAKLMAVINS